MPVDRHHPAAVQRHGQAGIPPFCHKPNAREREEARHAPTGYDRRLLLQDTTGLHPYIALCAFAGIRPTECTRLRWQDVDFEDSIISIRARNSKTGGARHIELPPTLAMATDYWSITPP